MKKTLQIKVHDDIGISEKETPKTPRIVRQFLVFVVETKSVLDILFGGVGNYSRPPTQGFTTNLAERAFSAFSSKFMVSSLTI